MPWPLALFCAFLAGSIPFGLLIGRLHGIDIREHGSRNIGATNLGRVLGRRWGFLCFLLDALKGAVPMIAIGIGYGWWGRSATELAPGAQWIWLAAAACAVLGHLYSPWVRFRGGKGVATGFGAMVAAWPLLTVPTALALLAWLLCVRFTRIVSLSSICAAATIPFSVLVQALRSGGEPAAALRAAAPSLLFSLLVALLVIVRHRANIGRLIRGEEPRIGAAGTAPR